MLKPAGTAVLNILSGGIAGLVVVFAVVAWLLSSGPISLAFLLPYFSDSLRQAPSPLALEFDDLVLEWAGWKRTLDVNLIGVRIFREDDQLAASFPKISIGVSGRDLLDGRFVLTRLDMLGVSARLVRRADGSLSFGSSAEPGQMGGVAADLLEELLREPDPTRLTGRLREISILQAEAEVVDELSGRVWRLPAFDAVFRRDDEGITGDAIARVEFGGQQVRLDLAGNFDRARQEADLSVDFGRIDLPALARLDPALAQLANAKMTATGRVDVTIDLLGNVKSAGFRVETGPGRVVVKEHLEAPLITQKVKVEGRFEPGTGRIVFDSLQADLGASKARGQGWFSLERRGDLSFSTTIDRLTVAQLKALWPITTSKEARDWVVSHIHDGLLQNVVVRWNSPETKESGRRPLSVSASYSGLSMTYYGDLPTLTDLSGTLSLDPDKFAMVAHSGDVFGLDLSEGAVDLSGLGTRASRARIRFVLSGPLGNMLGGANRRPLLLANRLNLDPAQLRGATAARFELRFPLHANLTQADVQFSAAANLSDVSVPGLLGGYDLSKANLQLELDGTSVFAYGNGLLNDVPLTLSWRRFFSDDAEVRAEYRLTGTFSDSARRALGLPSLEGLAGPVEAIVDVAWSGAREWSLVATLGLKNAQIAIPILNWTKPADRDGQFRFVLRQDPDGAYLVDSFDLNTGDLHALGSARFEADWSLSVLQVARLVYRGSAGTPLSVALQKDDQDITLITLRGDTFDARPYLAEFTGGASVAEAEVEPLKLSVRLNRLILEDGHELRDVAASARIRAPRIEALSISGEFGDADLIRIDIQPAAATRVLRVAAADAGRFARALDAFHGAVGGRLDLIARIRDDLPDRPIEGRLLVRDFRLARSGLVNRMITLTERGEPETLEPDQGIKFDRLDARFTMAGGKIHVVEGRAYGAQLGITADGVINRDEKLLDLKGTIVPAYALNSLPSMIPIIGDLLVGKEGEGVFGLTYTMSGPADDPKIEVNPVSALAPGVLRRIFSSGEGIGDRPPEQISR